MNDVKEIKISIITDVYNAVETLESTILSVLQQRYKNIEYIIIDGQSTDGTVDIIEKYNHSLRWVSEPDEGIYDAMNKGCTMSTGDYIQFLGAGDMLVDVDTVANVVKELSDRVDILSTAVNLVDEGLHIEIHAGNEVVRNKSLYCGQMIPHPGMFVKKDVMLSHLFDVNYVSAADYKFFLSCYLDEAIEFKYIDFETVYFGLSGLSGQSTIGIDEHLEIMKEFALADAQIHDVEWYKRRERFIKCGKNVLRKFGILKFILLRRNWKKHVCGWNFCRWCKGRNEVS